MPRVVAVALLLLATGSLAGCLDEGETGVFSAKDGLGAAEAKAQESDEAAVLVGVAGIETTEEAPDVGLEQLQSLVDALVPRLDKALGDGLLGAWLYSFQTSADDTMLHVVVDAHDGVTLDLETSAEGIEAINVLGAPITAWDLDSDAAADAAAGVTVWADALGQGPLGVGYALAQYEDAPASVWSAYTTPANGSDDGGAQVVVDGVDGSVLANDASGLFSEARFTRATRSATINNLSPQRTADFLVKPELKQIWIDLAWNGQGPTDSISVEFFDPAGTSIDTFSMTTGDSVTKHYPTPEPGDWYLEMALEQGIGGSYSLVWCMATEHYDDKPCED